MLKMNLQLFASNFISVDKLYYAVMTGVDSISGLPTYSAPKVLSPVAKISVDPSSASAAFYADGVLQEHAQLVQEGKVSIECASLSHTVQADIFGHQLDGAGGIIYNSFDRAPYVAILYRRKKANGKYRYVKLYKCLLEDSKADAESANATLKPQDDVIDGTFMARIYDNKFRYATDEEETGYVDVSATFFNAVDTGDVTPPTVSTTVPANNATGVSANTTFAWTFSEPIAPATVTTNNFFLIKDADGSIVAATIAYNPATYTVTLTPTSALSSASKYLAVATNNVTDLSMNKLVTVTKIFTTA